MRVTHWLTGWLAIGSALAQVPASTPPDQDIPLFQTTVLQANSELGSLLLADVDGDGDQDLLQVTDAGVRVRQMDSSGRYAQEAGAVFPWPSQQTAWDVADMDGDKAMELILFVDSKEVLRSRCVDGVFAKPTSLLKATGWQPHGVHQMRFIRDIDGDGRLDITIPLPAAHQLFLRRAEGFAEPLIVQFKPQVSQDFGDPSMLEMTISQTVSAPWFGLKDVDGDGHKDVVSNTANEIAFHIFRDGAIPIEPTWVLDIAALTEDLPDEKDIDLDNLLAFISHRLEWRLVDLDGVAPNDLIVSVGGKIRTWLGGSVKGMAGEPNQLLLAAGNLLWFFTRQIEGSPLPELQIVRGEKIGLGRILRYLILPGKITFDLFTYGNQAGRFTDRPVRKNKIQFGMPQLRNLLDDDGLGSAVEAQFKIPARRMHRNSDQDDVADLLNNELRVYEHCAPSASHTEQILDGAFEMDRFIELFLLDDLDRRGDGANTFLDLGDLATYEFSPGLILRRASQGKTAIFRAQIPEGEHRLACRDLTGNGESDLIVVTTTEQELTVQIFVRRP
ncbi:MAG: VCBS repeat-containing protein [Planctomycetota bacterium]|nr:VCBS repeat-containing protein [Planctomycetota bacterium]